MLLAAQSLPAWPLAFAAGLVSVLSPCVFPLIPAYAAYLGGEGAGLGAAGGGPGAATAIPIRRAPVLLHGIAFVLGFSAVFIAVFYVLVALDSTVLIAHRQDVDIAAGIIVIAFALHTLGVLRIPWLQRDLRFHPSGEARGAAGAALLGVSFGAGWTPCLGPTLGAISLVAASRGFGGLPLMVVYCLGLAVPFLVVAVLFDRLQGPIRAVNRRLRVVSLVTAALLLAFGVLLLTGQITRLSALSPGSPFDL
jgi:cytochrome c-type biogenesis protein